jgi:RNA polymerase sigma-70 factor (ECF subfamily)
VISLIARMTGDRELAEELAQDTFVKAYRNLAAFDTTRRLSSWLFRIAHNTALDALRRSRPRLVSLDATPEDGVETVVAPLAAAQADPVERRALGRAIEAALGTLRPEYRAAITLRYDENLSFAEIGDVLGVPETTARSHVHRARKELAHHLEAAGWAPAPGSSATPDSGTS